MKLTEHNEKLLELLYESTLMGWFIIETNGQILDMNIAGMEMLGLKEKKSVNIKDYIQHDTLGVFYDLLNNVNNRGKQHCKLSLINQENSEIYSFIEAFKIDHQHIFITAKDITDVEMLKESEIRYRKLFESSKDGILIINAHSGKIIDVNHNLTKILDMKEEELIGKAIWEILIFNNIINSEETYLELQNDENIHTYTIENSQGKIIEAEIVSNSYEFGHKREIQCNIRDISERKKQEMELEETQKRLEELHITKDKFFSLITHDLRSPFSSILGYSDLMLHRLVENDYSQLAAFTKAIHNASGKAMNLLANLIEWSRSQVGKLEFKPESISLLVSIDNALKYTIDSANQKSITIIKDIPEDFFVYIDREMFEVIIRNLISNAIKFTHKGGQVFFKAYRQSESILFVVQDSGIGMDENTKNKLFRLEGFGSKDGTEKEKGTGLGLLITKEFINKHNGNIWVESEPGKGSTFYFTIPNPVENIQKLTLEEATFGNK